MMGHIRFIFQDSGIDITDFSELRLIAPVQHFKNRYNIDGMEQLEVNSNDIIVPVDISELDDFDWENIPFPDRSTEKKVFEIIYNANIEQQLQF